MDKKQSYEDYLERILILGEENKPIHAIDLAKSFSYSRASLSIALKKLKEEGYISINSKQEITLTNKGKEIALSVYDKHKTISSLLIKIGVSEEIAFEDACKIEHVLSEETFNKIKEHLKK